MCIKEGLVQPGVNAVEFGEIYTVVLEEEHDFDIFYQLEERESNMIYRKSLFAPLSNIDETEYSTVSSDKVIEEVKIILYDKERVFR